jgi:hypothetical protein
MAYSFELWSSLSFQPPWSELVAGRCDFGRSRMKGATPVPALIVAGHDGLLLKAGVARHADVDW